MSNTEPGNSGGSSARKWDWSNPQNILAVIGIVAGLLGSVFGVAMAAPFGQDLLCKSFGLSCPRTEVSDVRLAISAIDFDGWCENWLAEMGKEQFPPPGFTNSPMDCRLDFTSTNPAGFAGMIAVSPGPREIAQGTDTGGGGVKAGPGRLLVAHLSMQVSGARVDTPFTLRVQCWRHDPSISMWGRVPCELRPPVHDALTPFGTIDDIISGYSPPSDETLPEGAVSVVLVKDQLDFIQRWRLDIEGKVDTNLPTGDYRVEIAIGAPGEGVQPARVQAEFNVYPPAPI